MNDQTPSKEVRTERLQGMGCKRKRVEDVRFVQGKGNYVDDLKLPGMIYGDFTRSPYGHARIKKIDATKAKAVPGVIAVLTAADLKPLSLHYMPTLAGPEPGSRLHHRRRPLYCSRRGRPGGSRV
jgi:aerobic carbon-monoxide dehydrogenase large subunit